MKHPRFPTPWAIRELGESYVIEAANGLRFGYIYFEDEPVRQRLTGRVCKDDARQLAEDLANFCNRKAQ